MELDVKASKQLDLAKQEPLTNVFRVFSTEIATIEEAVASNLGGVAAGALERIKLPGGGGTIWSLPGLEGEENYENLSVIILGFRDMRAYWSESLEQSSGNNRPDCFSMDAKYGSKFGNCQSCEYSKPGSSPKGGGQACKLTRELCVIRPVNVLPERLPLPPTSIGPCVDYFRRLAMRGLPVYSVVTKISLEKTKNSQGMVYSRAAFRVERPLIPEEIKAMKQLAAIIKPFLTSKNSNSGGSDEVM